MKISVTFLIVAALISTCKRLPKEQLYQFEVQTRLWSSGDSVFISFYNPILCPLRVVVHHLREDVDLVVSQHNPTVVGSMDSTLFRYEIPGWQEEWRSEFRLSSLYSAPEFFREDSFRYELPFPENRRYKIIQGYHGKFSHNSDFSRYALDFALQPGDTVCAVANGVVVGVIEGYDVGGNDRKFRPYANYLSVYHPNGIISQYVHLQHEGALVELGDSVKAGQPIGLAGTTGFTSTPHLHLNFLKPEDGSSVSTPVLFRVGPGASFRQGQVVSHPE